MTTTSNSSLAPSNTAAADFRAWASFVDSVFLLTGGWLDNADTGSINLTTVAAPGGANASQGFKVYKMNDALQSTAPIFVKIEFGSGGAAGTPSFWFTIGTGSDGAGTITGTIKSRTQHNAGASSTTPATKNLGSSGTNRAFFGLFLDGGVNQIFYWAIERSVDSTGAVTNEGVFLIWGHNNSGAPPFSNTQYVFRAATPVPPPEVGCHVVLGGANPTSIGADVGVSSVIPIAGVAKQPPLNGLVVRAGDFASYAVLTLTLYGASHTYVQLGPNIGSVRCGGTSSVDGNSRLMLRYE